MESVRTDPLSPLHGRLSGAPHPSAPNTETTPIKDHLRMGGTVGGLLRQVSL
jgi:hypothetical protein